MALTRSAAEAVLDAGISRPREPVVPPRGDTDESLLDAVRRGLLPGDPVARLLAGLTGRAAGA